MTNISLFVIAFALVVVVGQAASFNYAEAFQRAIYFFEYQKSGPLEYDGRRNAFAWRGESLMNDGKDVGIDLTGGMVDAGDNVKFLFPLVTAFTDMAWAAAEFPEVLEATNLTDEFLHLIKFNADFIMKCHTKPNEFWGQMGMGSVDHAIWVSQEVLDTYMTAKAADRPSYKIDASCGGADLAGSASTCLAAAYMLFQKRDATYAAKLLQHAKELYAFAETKQQAYSECIKDAAGFYRSFSGYKDELTFGAAMLYLATNDKTYLDKAEAAFDNIPVSVDGFKPDKWTHGWDDKSYGSYILLYRFTKKDVYAKCANRWLEYWTTGIGGSSADRVKYTPGGLAFLDTWGATRYSSSTVFVGMIYARDIEATDAARAKTLRDFAQSQIHYILGDNPIKHSYLIGYGSTWAKNPHHRTCHGGWLAVDDKPEFNRHTCLGLLSGSPTATDAFNDKRQAYENAEGANDYNAAFVSAMFAWLSYQLKSGGNIGSIIANYPPAETPPDTELFVNAGIFQYVPNQMSVTAHIVSTAAWPARVSTDLAFRFYVTLTSAEGSVDDVKVSSKCNCTISKLTSCDSSKGVYYVELSFKGQKIYPGGYQECFKEVTFTFDLPSGKSWDSTDDWSVKTSLKGGQPTEDPSTASKNIVVYENGAHKTGTGPGGGTCDGAAPPYKPPTGTVVDPSSNTVCSTVKPCKNGGACSPVGSTSYRCTCVSPYSGDTCTETTQTDPTSKSTGTQIPPSRTSATGKATGSNVRSSTSKPSSGNTTKSSTGGGSVVDPDPENPDPPENQQTCEANDCGEGGQTCSMLTSGTRRCTCSTGFKQSADKTSCVHAETEGASNVPQESGSSSLVVVLIVVGVLIVLGVVGFVIYRKRSSGTLNQFMSKSSTTGGANKPYAPPPSQNTTGGMYPPYQNAPPPQPMYHQPPPPQQMYRPQPPRPPMPY